MSQRRPALSLPDPTRHPLYGLIVAGGSGTRLWPVSRSYHPKQLLSLGLSEASLLQDTFRRLNRTIPPAHIYTGTGRTYRDAVIRQLHEVAPHYPVSRILAEPRGRGSAPAILWGALRVARQSPQALLAVVWSDHLIRNEPLFDQDLARAARLAAEGGLVAIGVTPTRPETGFGYIQAGEPNGEGAFHVRRFVEKPSRRRAQRFLAQGNYTWNAGLFVFRVDSLLDEYRTHAPTLLAAFERHGAEGADSDAENDARIEAVFEEAPEGSLDAMVLEKTDNLRVIPCPLEWSDVGSWDVIYETADKDEAGNAVRGNAVTLNTRNSLIHSDHRLVATVGVENLIVVDTEDALLICDMRRVQDVRALVSLLRDQGHPEAHQGTTTHRPWGSFTILQRGPGFQLKLLEVHPGEAMSLQLHHQRDEHWIVIEGEAEVVLGEETRRVNTEGHVLVPRGLKHRIGNPGDGPLRIVELQRGEYLGEDDIVRFEDRYGRQ